VDLSGKTAQSTNFHVRILKSLARRLKMKSEKENVRTAKEA
jgi:hypothetical protein